MDELVDRLRAAGCVFAEDEARLLREASATDVELASLTARRVAGEPLEQVLGQVEFCGLRLVVTPGVFVPRQRSEFLVRAAALRTGRGATVLDLCCGTGALGLALATLVDGIRLHAADVSPAAVACARSNLHHRGAVHESDLFAGVPDTLRGRVDTLLANVPYVPSGQINVLPREAREHEPRAALDGGPDGLDVLRRVAAQAPRWLAPGGHLWCETSVRQAAAATAILRDAGLIAAADVDEDLGTAALVGTRPASS